MPPSSPPRVPYTWGELGPELRAAATAKGLGKVPGEEHRWILGDEGDADPIRGRFPAVEVTAEYIEQLDEWKRQRDKEEQADGVR